MQDAPHESEPTVVLPDFRLCPHCKSSAFRRLDDDDGFFSDSNFFLALSIWLVLVLLAPEIIFRLWQPTKETIIAHIDLVRFMLSLSTAGFWILKHGAIWVLIAAGAFHGYGRLLKGCAACGRGFFCDHAFKPNGLLSRAVLIIISIANLRRKLWLAIPATLTIRAVFVTIALFALPLISSSPGFAAFAGAIAGAIIATSLVSNTGHIAVWSAAISAAGCFAAAYFSQPILLAVPPAALIGYWVIHDNHCSRLNGVTHQAFRSAGLATIKRLPMLLILLIPGLGLKAGIDWSANHVLNAVEARTATIDTLTVPTIREEKYPWHSPLRWLGVPRYTRNTAALSLEKPKETFLSAVRITRTLMDTLEVISLAILVLLFGRVLVSMFIRELIVQGVQLNAYLPVPRKIDPKMDNEAEEPQRDEESQARIESHASLVIDQTWAASVFLKRDLSPTGGVPSTEIPASKMAFLARLIHHCLVMDRYALKDTPIQLDSSDGHRFVRWELREGEVLYFNFAQVVGWTSAIRFDTAPCLQVGMLAQGKVLVHRAYGPGSLIFNLHGEPGVWAHDKGATFTPDRLVACRIDVKQGDGHPDFKIIAAGGLLNSFIGTVSQQASIGTALLLDPKGRRASHSHPVFDLLRQTYTIFG